MARHRDLGRVKVVPRALLDDHPWSEAAVAYIRANDINPLTLLRWRHYERLVEWADPSAGTYLTGSDRAEIATWEFG